MTHTEIRRYENAFVHEESRFALALSSATPRGEQEMLKNEEAERLRNTGKCVSESTESIWPGGMKA